MALAAGLCEPLPSSVGELPGRGQRVADSLDAIGELAVACGITRALVVESREALGASGARYRLDAALQALDCTRFDAFTPNPRCEEAAAAARMAAEFEADGVIAVGGGSCLDVAKVAALAARNPSRINELSRGEGVADAEPLPLVVAPSTSGTGSEATHFAAIYVDGKKVSIAHQALRPSGVVLDAGLHMAMPGRLAAVTGLDALCQAMESLWAAAGTEASRCDALVGGTLVVRALASSVRTAGAGVRTEVMLGAHIVGHAINISKTTAAHALSYAMTERFGLAHGHAVALTVGELGAFNGSAGGEVRGRVELAAGLLGAAPEAMPARMRGLLKELGLPLTLSEAGVPRAALDSLAASIDPVRLSNNPRAMTHADALGLLERSFA